MCNTSILVNCFYLYQEKAIRAEFVDSIVITHYNKMTYKICDIDFTVKPDCRFMAQDGTVHAYDDYYLKRYGMEVKTKNQPLLVSTPRKKDVNKGVTNNIYLVPEFCHPTGLTDVQRKNFTLMKKLSAHLHMSPEQRKKTLDDFMRKLRDTKVVQDEFNAWGITFCSTPLETTGRVLPREKIIIGDNEPVDADQKGDWGRCLGRGKTMFNINYLMRRYTKTPSIYT
jgi:aubergine-like protein